MNTSPGDRITVLIADDDARVRRALRAFVESTGQFAVVGETSTVAGTECMVRRAHPAVVLLDLLLPAAGDGLDLVRRLSGDGGCRVVAMSVRSGLERAALHAGATLFADKGMSPDALLQLLAVAAGR